LGKKEKERKKDYTAAEKILTSTKEKGLLGKKRPFTRKEESSQ